MCETLTVEEYQKLSPGGRSGYRLFRHPLVMFGLGPIWMFLIKHRWPSPRFGKKETMGVVWTNLAILVMAAGLSWWIGFYNYVLIQLPVLWIAGMVGIWMFYIQHQFESVYWARTSQWNYLIRRFKGRLLLPPAQSAGMVQWEYRISPYPSPHSPRAELPACPCLPIGRNFTPGTHIQFSSKPELYPPGTDRRKGR